MLQKLINHNTDLSKLWTEGYNLQLKDGYLMIQDVPYVNSDKCIGYGTLVSTLNLSGDKTLKPETHVIYFQGEAPCRKEGQKISSIINSSKLRNLTSSISVDHLFSSKPMGGYSDYYEKVTTYVNIITAPAISLDENVTAKMFKTTISNEDDNSPFNYIDTNSTRAGIRRISEKLTDQRIGIIGLGGTGSYILDLVSKNPVREIHLFDNDYFLQHNAFRAPGAAKLDDIKSRIKKVDYLHKVYSNIHKGIIPHSCYLNSANIQLINELDFVFISIDKGSIKKLIVEELFKHQIPFVDVGMGVELVDDQLIGMLRATTGSNLKKDHLTKRISFDDGEKNEYNANIQIAELNAMNAVMAVIKWKKIYGFYQDHEHEHNSSYTTNVNMLLSEDLSS